MSDFDAPQNDPSRSAAPGEASGDRIDRYRLIEEIGEGGMGTVWLAEQSEPVTRRVALKVIKLGMDTREVVARFEAERQALALMDHPGIAKVFDGGATRGGRPFFVMELVDGAPITDYCDRQGLDLHARLELFARVGDAIQHAHQKGIIHRDIKPSNVLVALHDGVPTPKVIDFGIAKATNAELAPHTLLTSSGQIIGTPEYMAPEQAEISGIDIDTRADVYALGALLYEMLTGTQLFDAREVLRSGLEELLRTIREVDPERPSTRISTLGERAAPLASRRLADVTSLQKHLAGDLDWIVMKALEKDRSRRYETASGLAEDVRRFLNEEAVLAAPPSASYRIGKFVRRRKKTVAAVAAIAVLFVAGTIGTGVGLRNAMKANRALEVAIGEKEQALVREKTQRERAQQNESRAREAEIDARQEAERANRAEAEATQRAAELEQVADFQAAQLRGIDPALMGVRLQQALVDRVPEPQRADLRASLSGVNFTSLALGVLSDNLFQETLDAIETQFSNQLVVQAQLLQSIATTLRDLGLLRLAGEPQARALEIRERELGREHPATLYSLSGHGVLMKEQGQVYEAEPILRDALERHRAVLGADHPKTVAAIADMGLVFDAQGKYDEAEPFFREALERARRTEGDEAPATISAIHNMGALHASRAQFDEAEPYWRDAHELSRRVLGEEHSQTLLNANNLAVLLSEQFRYEEAVPYYRDVFEARRRKYGDEHPETLVSMHNLGSILGQLGQLAEGEQLLRTSLETSVELMGKWHPHTLRNRSGLGRLLIARDRLEDAEELLREGLAGSRATLGPEHAISRVLVEDLALLLQRRIQKLRGTGSPVGELDALSALADLRLEQGEFERAGQFAKLAFDLATRELSEADWRRWYAQNQLGAAAAGREQYAGAEPLLLESVERLLAIGASGESGRAATVSSLERACELYDAWHRREPGQGYDESASAWRAELAAFSE